MKNKISRRDSLKLSGLAMSGLALGLGGSTKAKAGSCDEPRPVCYPTTEEKTQQYSYGPAVPFIPGTAIGSNEMRITFLGSTIPPVRRAQQMMSVFVEVGDAMGQADQFVFDCGSGVCANYGAMGIPFRKMDKIFLAHLHGDHMSDLTHIYCFGPSADRKSPLFVWGPGPSGVKNPKPSGNMPFHPATRYYEDGTRAFCQHLREAMRWHSESFSFQTTSYASYQPPTQEDWGLPHKPIPVGDDSNKDGFAIIPIELNWTKYGEEYEDNVAYKNAKSGVKITHFPVIHCRKGSIGYKLEWNGLSMIYTSDTKPEIHCIDQAINGGAGVDVFIHEMVVPPEVWAMKNAGYPEIPPDGTTGWDEIVAQMKMVQDSSHTPQGAFGYLLKQITPRPRLTVATHFPTSDDTVECAIQSVRSYCPDIKWQTPNLEDDEITWSTDLMVISVQAGNPKPKIVQQIGVVSDYGYSPETVVPDDMNPPKYWKWALDEHGKPVKVGDPFAQIDPSAAIPAGDSTYCEDGY